VDAQRGTQLWNYRFLGLLFLVGECFRLGIRYTPLSGTPEVLPAGLQIITHPLPEATGNWHPIYVYGAAWLLNGFVALFTFRRPLLHRAAYIAAGVGMFYWSMAYLVAQFESDDKTSWFTASGYALFCFITIIIGHATRPKRGDQ
jgi:hypothetical protein